MLLQVRPASEGLQANLVQRGFKTGLTSTQKRRKTRFVVCVRDGQEGEKTLQHISSPHSSSSSWQETPECGLDETWQEDETRKTLIQCGPWLHLC